MSETQTNESTGLLGEIADGMHNLEQKIEHALHLDGAGNAAGGASSDQQSQGETSAQDALGLNAGTDAGNGTPGQASNAEPSTGDQSGSAPAGEAGNDQSASDISNAASMSDLGSSVSPQSSQAMAMGADGGEQGNASPASGDSKPVDGAVGSTTTDARAEGEDPNAAAQTAAAASASGMQSSAQAASPLAGAPAIAASVSEQVSKRVYKLRQHFWTFEASARAPFIQMLDEIEALVK